MEMPKGIAYFKDGHAEEIIDYRTFGLSGFAGFTTSSGTYYYEENVHKISDGYFAKRHKFSKAGRPIDEDAGIDKIVLI